MCSAKIIELNEQNTCKLCENALAKYSCPKCNVLYCSLSCYQSEAHWQCSEKFYRECIMEEMKLDDNNPIDRKKMLDILKRCHENNPVLFNSTEGAQSDVEDFDFDDEKFALAVDELDSDDNEYSDLADRLAGVDLDDAETVWDKLTEDERQEFVAFLKSEDVSKLIKPWEPWWTYYSANKIQELDDSKQDEFKLKCPSFIDMKDFDTICKKVPADCVKFNLMNILASYVFTARYFNGEHQDFAPEAVSSLVTLSLVLNSKQNFASFDEAVTSVEQECINSDWIVIDEENKAKIKEDVERILVGPTPNDRKYYILCALSDISSLLKAALIKKEETKSAFKIQFPNDHLPNVKHLEAEKINECIKKIDYFLAYTKDILNLF